MAKYVACVLFLVAAACGGDSNRTTNPDGGGGGGSDGGGSGSGGSGVQCGGLAGSKCEPTEYCDYANNTCGAADETGTCKTRQTICPAAIGASEVCGCDGKLYPNACEAHSAGTDLNANGSCPEGADHFACGYLQCDLTTQYCVHDTKAASADQAYVCAALPQACGTTAACGCLAGVQCGTDCTGDGTHGLTVTCQ